MSGMPFRDAYHEVKANLDKLTGKSPDEALAANGIWARRWGWISRRWPRRPGKPRPGPPPSVSVSKPSGIACWGWTLKNRPSSFDRPPKWGKINSLRGEKS